MNTSILSALQWRYAVKIFDASKKVEQKDLDLILEAGRLAPSSLGFQPWSFVVVENPELRKKLREASWNQAQITDASHLVVICRPTVLDEAYVQEVIRQTANIRNIDEEQLSGLKEMMMGKLQHSTEQELAQWSALQCYLALGMMLETAALLKVDACPMEGFDAKAYDAILNLEKQGLASVVVCAIGHRSQDDKYAHAAKARFPASKIIHKR